MTELVEQIKELASTQKALIESNKEMKSWVEKSNSEIDTSKKLEAETKAALEKLCEKSAALTDKCLELERKMAAGHENGNPEQAKSAGQQMIDSDGFKAMQQKRSNSASIELKTAIVNATGASQPLVQAMRVPGIITAPERLLTVRDLLSVGRTGSNLIEYTRENVYTNNAGPQYSSPNFENVTKPESGITFAMASAAVATIAHFIPVSKQVLSDAPQLQSYIDGRLLYGLKLEEEDELLNGSGTAGNLSGLLDSGNFTAYNRAVSGDTILDTLRRAITQAALSEYAVDAIILNPEDWEAIELLKTTYGEYLFGGATGPVNALGPQVWGRRIVSTNSIAQGTFLTGGFYMGAQIWDREEANVSLAYEDGDNFKKNMVTIRAEERIALTVYRPAAFVSGTFA